MTRLFPNHTAGLARKTASRLALGFLALQGAVIAGLLALDTIKKHSRRKRKGFPHPGTFDQEISGTQVTTYTYGEDLYRDMIQAIRDAEHTIYIETFIWKDDTTGRQFKNALNEAAGRGVDVFVIYDGFANLVVPHSFFRFHPAIHVYRFPVIRPSMFFKALRSTGLDHRKILVVDDRTGFVGGYNIGSLYATEWRDTHLRLVGPSVWDLRQAFANVWNAHTSTREKEIPHTGPDVWEPRISAVNNIPANLVYPIRGVYLEAIDRAQDHIYVSMAYFIPDQQILRALLAASERGVDVRIILPKDSNHVLSDWLSRGFYKSLLEAGVTILLYRNAMIHAKTATIDGAWSTVGSANIDRLSLTGNYEINLEIHDEDFAADMRKIFEADSKNCQVLTTEEWQHRSPLARFSETVLVPLRPLL
ncbi:phospholipase D-like domain-containing protein [Pseudarthrobacter sp. PS3-L1]|uniref:phospholipase D-like domain-containing protein n=1 Tax=Pseudarthrobacter sp. PS3-L1 TaxID=3046207 RepID=UPI0024BB620E|nr:phospholipase D-like domain-containing protein [Pseudarthrobacter sp. PS3-L1]MDJ0319078.1 phospholipase D-like domain-containing protein [Pseudarthrobacter sp. PS3-L1]